MRALFLLATVLMLSSNAKAQSNSERQFTYEGVALGARLSSLPTNLRTNCETARDPKYTFCEVSSAIEDTNLEATLSFVQETLVEVQVYFAADRFDLVWSALRAKYGMEDLREQDRFEWYTNPVRPDLPIPDEMALYRTAKIQPVPDGSRFKANVNYSSIEYRSLEQVRQSMRARTNERNRKVQGLSDKL